uniref:Metallophos_C domain-containing protein n=1 Tax=Steinernema glaseri TaxID=37863 RepID=A0A1I8AIU8_9BILA
MGGPHHGVDKVRRLRRGRTTYPRYPILSGSECLGHSGQLLTSIGNHEASFPQREEDLGHASQKENVRIKDVDLIHYRWPKSFLRGKEDKKMISLKTVCKLTNCSTARIYVRNLEAVDNTEDDEYLGPTDDYDKYYAANDTKDDFLYLPKAVDVLSVHIPFRCNWGILAGTT